MSPQFSKHLGGEVRLETDIVSPKPVTGTCIDTFSPKRGRGGKSIWRSAVCSLLLKLNINQCCARTITETAMLPCGKRIAPLGKVNG
jgi:hypothetical protein